MDTYMPGHANNSYPGNGAINILLVGGSQTRKVKKALEFEGEFDNVSEARNDDEILASMDYESPDVIIAVTDDGITVEGFDRTLRNFTGNKMNERTIIISENPFRYFKSAIKNKVAALVHRQINMNDLIPIIHEVYAWSHGQLVPCENRQGMKNPVLRRNQEVNEM
jgi:DNA-binding NarL/FixJ family response regulator